ncbi:MAG: glycerol-3-phosphate 1-O-acyltransferase PlsY [Bacteroidetes bacterium]|nr:glycerol-3-phosphate 1-O-acyltransferase PlsY [Bacteroidota bacterium]
MITVSTIIGLIVAYLFGSIPSAVWIGKIFYKIDVREYGSGNSGATNTFRVLGKRAGIAVMTVDILKGFFATRIAFFIGDLPLESTQFINFQLSLGIAAVLGHIFPIYAGFRGGKGIATLLGMVISLHPPAAFICVIIFVTTLIITQYVSLSSILASVTFPLLTFFIYQETEPSLRIFGIAIAFLVITTHQKNIERLWNGEENKAHLFKRKKN